MGEFDLSLISEYRNRPSFYDRNSLRFRDKLYNARQWQEISNKLGFDVSILKDRILQLRNRYNLEKRRIEQLREENPNKFYVSPWPLYDHLQFLSDHIRARRSYKKLLPLNGSGGPYATGLELSNSCSNNSNITLRHVTDSGMPNAGGDMEGENQNITAFPNGLLAVKMEDGSEETEDEMESQNNGSEIHAFETAGLIPETHSSSLPSQHLQQKQHSTYKLLQQQQQHQQEQQQQKQPTISIRRLDSLRQDYADSSTLIFNKKLKLQRQQRSQHSSFLNQSSMQNDDDSAVSTVPQNQPSLNPREFKYTAFGNFVSSSLLDLPPSIALDLVEKFTSDIVKVLMANAQPEHKEQQQDNDSEN